MRTPRMGLAVGMRCASCECPITDPYIAMVTADHVYDDAGRIRGFVNWRVVHKGVCDPDRGPWHPLEMFLGQRGAKVFRRMRKDGAFVAAAPGQVEALEVELVNAALCAIPAPRPDVIERLRGLMSEGKNCWADGRGFAAGLGATDTEILHVLMGWGSHPLGVL